MSVPMSVFVWWHLGLGLVTVDLILFRDAAGERQYFSNRAHVLHVESCGFYPWLLYLKELVWQMLGDT